MKKLIYSEYWRKWTKYKMTIKDNNIYFPIDNSNGERYWGFVALSQIKQVCEIFNTTKILNEALIILHNTIEVFLTEDKREKNIEFIFLELEEAKNNDNKVIKEPMNFKKNKWNKSNGNEKKVLVPGMTAKNTLLSQTGIKSKEMQKTRVNKVPFSSIQQ